MDFDRKMPLYSAWQPIINTTREWVCDSHKIPLVNGVTKSHGRIFDMSYQKDGTVVIAASFGGLLMWLTGDQQHLANILPDMRLYLLLKKD